MNAVDFTYDGIKLSSFGFIIASFDSRIKTGEATTDSIRTFDSVSLFGGAYKPFISTVYKDALVMKWQICKNPCIYDDANIIIATDEMRSLKQWLSRPTPHKLTIDDDEYNGMHWDGSFNVEEVCFGDMRLGATLTFTCNRPFALGDECNYEGEIEADSSIHIENTSDDIGYLFPTMVIKCLESGTLQLTNVVDGRITEIKNVVEDEVLTFSEQLVCSSSVNDHIGDDYNFKPLRLWKDYSNGDNEIQSNLHIAYQISYKPAIKEVFV